MYSALYRNFSAVGLVAASDVGIAANCLVIAFLLSKRKLVPLAGLEWKEIGKALAVSLLAGALSWEVARVVQTQGSRVADLKALALMLVTWAGAAALGLWLTRSTLLQDLRRR
jgi:putative peptidoglycan lipid II flippase